ncbi:LacI family DNA-binding transcriptional regulator [Marinilabilia rubra]|uniref:LacI family transcriptional regulator n=1 Tax=Marinilabilia rubra TaxID=2162893 RepID=A0A2U2B6M7_9BACT|nr:substrate-binding domain-containing protein [Marinilabilia rubra]PWD98729.1 LacI family transcriptional regulator [Marinilabilia rubra]
MKQVRIKDIAEKADVSIGTVDRVLHNRGEVAQKTREKVLAIAKEMNYQPNIVAQALTTKKTYKFSVLIPKGGQDNVYWLAHPKGIEKAVHELQPFSVEIDYRFFELHNEVDFLTKTREILENPTDGVILAPILKNEALHFCEELDRKKIPYIFIDTFLDNTNCISFIGEDAFQGGRVAASLIDFGIAPEKDILVVNLAKNLENTQHLNRRNQGFLSYFLDTGQNTGMKITVEIHQTDKETVEAKIDKVLKQNPNIGAILVSSAKTHVIARYLEKKRLDTILVGYEITRKNTDYLKKGIIHFLIGQRPMDQSEKAVKRLFEYLTSHTIALKHEFQPVEIINTETLSMY